MAKPRAMALPVALLLLSVALGTAQDTERIEGTTSSLGLSLYLAPCLVRIAPSASFSPMKQWEHERPGRWRDLPSDQLWFSTFIQISAAAEEGNQLAASFHPAHCSACTVHCELGRRQSA
jgi:hypothetical protein